MVVVWVEKKTYGSRMPNAVITNAFNLKGICSPQTKYTRHEKINNSVMMSVDPIAIHRADCQISSVQIEVVDMTRLTRFEHELVTSSHDSPGLHLTVTSKTEERVHTTVNAKTPTIA